MTVNLARPDTKYFAFKRLPVVGLLGARQVGKTTLAAAIARNSKVNVTRVDLEDPAAVARLADPMLALGGLRVGDTR